MHEWILWVLVAASALHVMEEHALGWQGWATSVMGKKLGVSFYWQDFYVTNAALFIVGISTAMVGWQFVAFGLSFAALNIIDATLFHILPSILAKRLNPGCITATVIYLPVGFLCYWAASTDQVLTAGTLWLSILIGAFFMASALVGPKLRNSLGYPDESN
ncbi:MAG: hypothetical protein QG553_216 [Patescibacteria group bacterium]|nr:hypothetical protein [Patescibacteria group bacterium]